jgi:heme exporter protein B
MNIIFHQIKILIWKDLLIDLRRKENLISMLLFAILAFLVFHFSIGSDTSIFTSLLPGIVWVVFLLSGVLGLGKSFQQEIETGCIEALLMSPTDRSILFLGKMIATTLFLLISQFLFIPLCLLLYEINVRSWTAFGLVLLAGTLGFSSLGTLLSVMTATIRGREMLLPILLFPLIVPNLLSLVHLTDNLFFGNHAQVIESWWTLLLTYNVVLITLSIIGFEFVVEE